MQQQCRVIPLFDGSTYLFLLSLSLSLSLSRLSLFLSLFLSLPLSLANDSKSDFRSRLALSYKPHPGQLPSVCPAAAACPAATYMQQCEDT